MGTEKLSCETARTICIVKTLASLGHFPNRTAKKEAWFLSPLRTETEASFKVSLIHNRWYDFGIGKGGNVLDLVCLILNCSVGEALGYLSSELPVSSSYRKKEVKKQKRESKNKILKISPIEHRLLKKYLYSRKIPVSIANNYCREIWYECNGNEFFAIGLQNHLGGWELRNRFCKSSTSPKTYSYLKKDKQQLILLEGMFDLLSLATLLPDEATGADIVVLNSLSFLPKVSQIFEDYATVTLYLDRDPSGIKATADMLESYSHCTDQSGFYKGYKDLNEKLLNGKKS